MLKDGIFHHQWTNNSAWNFKIEWFKYSSLSDCLESITVSLQVTRTSSVTQMLINYAINTSSSTTWQLITISHPRESLQIGHTVEESGSVKTKLKWSGSARKINWESFRLFKETIWEKSMLHFTNYWLRLRRADYNLQSIPLMELSLHVPRIWEQEKDNRS